MTKQKIIEKFYFRLPKDTSVHKDWSHATGRPVDNLPSKIENLQKFSNNYSWEQTEHVSRHYFEFLHNILLVSFKNYQTQYRQRHIQSPIKDLRCSFWRQ